MNNAWFGIWTLACVLTGFSLCRLATKPKILNFLRPNKPVDPAMKVVAEKLEKVKEIEQEAQFLYPTMYTYEDYKNGIPAAGSRKPERPNLGSSGGFQK